MNKNVIFYLVILCFSGSMHAMEMPLDKHNEITIPANEECLICTEEASDIEKGERVGFST